MVLLQDGVSSVEIGRRFAVPVGANNVEVVRGGLCGAHCHPQSLVDLLAQDQDVTQAGHTIDLAVTLQERVRGPQAMRQLP